MSKGKSSEWKDRYETLVDRIDGSLAANLCAMGNLANHSPDRLVDNPHYIITKTKIDLLDNLRTFIDEIEAT